MSLLLYLTILLITPGTNCKPKLIYSLRHDYHDFLSQLLHRNCLFLNQNSSLFICSNDFFYHIQFDIGIGIAPFQSKPNTCGIILKYNQISMFPGRENRTYFSASHDFNKNHNEDFVLIQQRSMLSIDVRRAVIYIIFLLII